MKFLSEVYKLAVVGSTGTTGREVLKVLAEYNFPSDNILAIASERSVGMSVSYGETKVLKVQSIETAKIDDVQIAFFCAGSNVSKNYSPKFLKNKSVIIDKTSYFRLNREVPLIVPEVNGKKLYDGASGIISNPNCVAIPLSIVLNALKCTGNKIKRVVVSTYQSVSGAGKDAVEELYSQAKGILSCIKTQRSVFQKQIAFNVIPCIGNILPSGDTEEEEKISSEVIKILGYGVKVAVQCVRVPVFIGHSMSIFCEFSQDFSPEDASEVLSNSQSIVVINTSSEGSIVTPVDVQGENNVYISRIRQDKTVPHGLIMWVCCDNLRKGAALNSVQIAQAMYEIDPSLESFSKNIK